MILMSIGIPGIGKSTYLKQEFDGEKHWYLSGDMTREEITGSESDLSRDDEVWELVRDRFKDALSFNKNVILDATFTTAKRRKPFFDLIRGAEEPQHLRLFVFPLDSELARKRNKKRERKVPESVIIRFAAQYEPIQASELVGIHYDIVEVK